MRTKYLKVKNLENPRTTRLSGLGKAVASIAVASMLLMAGVTATASTNVDHLAGQGPGDGEFKGWTKQMDNGNQVKFYAKYLQPGQKVQFMVQNSSGVYEEFAWKRVESADLNPDGSYADMQNHIYFIRTLDLKPGKNRLRILVEGERVWGTKTYTIKGSSDDNSAETKSGPYAIGDEIDPWGTGYTWEVEFMDETQLRFGERLQRFMVKSCVPEGGFSFTYSTMDWVASDANYGSYYADTYWKPSPDWLRPAYADMPGVTVGPGDCIRGYLGFEAEADLKSLSFDYPFFGNPETIFVIDF